jgi:hypothetical protein
MRNRPVHHRLCERLWQHFVGKKPNVNNIATIFSGELAQLVTYLVTRFCYHAQNAAARVNIQIFLVTWQRDMVTQKQKGSMWLMKVHVQLQNK